MKLKEAIATARKLGYSWVAADAPDPWGEMDIYAHNAKPTIDYDDMEWYNRRHTATSRYTYLGEYTGSKEWTDTLREVK